LTRSADVQALFQKGQRIDRLSLIVLWRESDTARRVGFAVSRQVRNAVKRNRARRRLREAWRRTRDAAPEQIAIVIIGRPAALTMDFNDLVAELHGALGGIPGPVERTT
jgi:ribonuclease P protein component